MEKFDIVSCQFTLHYFFKSTETLEQMIINVSNALKIDGFFIGTTMIGERVQQFVRKNEFPGQVMVEAVNDRSYKIKYLEQNEDAGTYMTKEVEYYVNFALFERKCKEHGLILLGKERVSFKEIYAEYKKTVPKKFLLKKYEIALTELNDRFIFVKKF